MIANKLFCVLFVFHETLSTPFLYNAPQALTSFISSASASASSPASTGNIVNLRKTKAGKLQEDVIDNDDFFKQSFDNEVDQTPAPAPTFLRSKLNKVFQKFRILQTITGSGQNSDTNDDDFQKEQDDFDKEFDKDFASQDLLDGYFYNKPEESVKSEKQEAFNIGVFFMELIGSLVGLAYGAAAQLNNAGGSTTTPST